MTDLLGDRSDGEGLAPVDHERQTLALKLRTVAPMRGAAPQVNALDTPLFGKASQPDLI